MLDRQLIFEHLSTTRYGRSLEVKASTGSTNQDAQNAAISGAANGHTLFADMQTHGRGSNGRQWLSPAGTDLYLSIVDRPPVPLAQLPPLTLAVGLGVADTVCEAIPFAADEVAVKWPNDVWLRGKKCAGILVEASSIGDQLHSLVIGIGLNVNRDRFPSTLEHPGTSLRLESQSSHPSPALRREPLAARLLLHIEAWVQTFCKEGPERVSEALNGRLALQGEAVQCGEVSGTLAGVAPDGALQVQGSTGLKRIMSGRLSRA